MRMMKHTRAAMVIAGIALAAGCRSHDTMSTDSSTIEVGGRAPMFTLADADGQKVALKDFAGQWVVVYFYPKADTPGCTTEACEFTDGIEQFADLDAVVIGISPDKPEALAKFRDKYKLKVTLLSDPDKKVMTKYGAYGEKMNYGKKITGVIRSTAIVDPKGKIAHHWKSVKAAGHAAKVQQKLAELQGG
jgi:peroxiredoxin Q/BCP